MGSCAAPSAKGDDKFITTDYLQQCLLARCLVGEHLAHLGLFQLAFRVLVKAADPDVADAVPLHDVSLVEGGLSALSVPLCLKAHFCQAEIYNLRGHVSKNGKADSILTKRRGPA